MTQAVLLDAGPKPRAACVTCGGRLKASRCRPCQKDTPAPSGPAWRRWTRGIDRVVRTRLDGAGLGHLWADTWEALLFDGAIPLEAAPLVEDVARLPFSPRRYRRVIDRALTRAHVGQRLHEQGLRGTERDPYKIDNIAARAAALIWAQRDRVAAGEVFERCHDAEIVHQAVLEHEAREQLRADRWRGARLEAEVVRLVEIAMRDVRGRYGRPSDEYPKAMRIEVENLRLAPLIIEDDAVIEAAEEEAAEPRRGRAA